MEDGELESLNPEVFSSSNAIELPNSCSMDSFLDEILKDTHACTHAHTCNPSGPDYSHTHTCFHVHTKIVSSPTEEKVSTDDTAESADKKTKKRPLGNREAVRKYREKKKARAASLEGEVVRLRALNQQLLKRLQGQAALEAEISRLKCLLVDIRGRIEGEIGTFPYQKSANSNLPNQNAPGSYVTNPCNVQCNDQAYCLNAGTDGRSGESVLLNGQSFTACDFENLECLANKNTGAKELPDCGLGDTISNVNSSELNQKKEPGNGGISGPRPYQNTSRKLKSAHSTCKRTSSSMYSLRRKVTGSHRTGGLSITCSRSHPCRPSGVRLC